MRASIVFYVDSLLMRIAGSLIAFVLAARGDGTDHTALARASPRALAIGWGGAAELDIAWQSFATRPFTVHLWVMPQFPHAYAGPILADERGTIVVGQGDYRWGSGGFKREGDPVLYLKAGDAHAMFAVREWSAGRWVHLALVREGDACALHVDGRRVGQVALPNGWKPLGRVRLGRLGKGVAIGAALVGKDKWNTSGYQGQFLGIIDDVVVLDRASSAAEVAELASRRAPSAAASALAACTFDVDGGWKATNSRRGSRVAEAVRAIEVSATRDSLEDASSIPVPSNHLDLRLPVLSGEPWLVVQGFDSAGGSHNGYAAFCLDLIRAGLPPESSRGESILAAADGRVVGWLEDESSGSSRANFIVVRHKDDLHTGYLHLEQGSITRCFRRSRTKDVVGGQAIAAVGDSGTERGNAHLHFALSDEADDGKAPIVTIPFSLRDYLASDDGGATWRRVERGVPLPGQWIKREK